MERPSISFFVMDFLLVFAIISFIFIVFDLRGYAFVFELGLLLAFMFFLAFAMFMIYNNKRSSWSIIGAILILMLFDMLFIFLFTRKFTMAYIFMSVFSIIGLLVVLANAIVVRKRSPETLPQYEKTKYYYPFSEKEEAKSEVKEQPKVVSVFSPGKYVASQKAKTFHAAKCEWATNIKKSNRVWFNSREDAVSKGFEAHACVG